MRHIRRLKRAYLNYGAKGLINKKRGKTSNRKLPNALKELSIALISEHYSDFNPTFATEKLVEIHGLSVSRETVR